MANPLYRLPGLGAFYAAQDRNAAASGQELQQGMQLLQAGDYVQKQARRRKLEEMAQLAGGDPNKLFEMHLQAGDTEGAQRIAQAATAQAQMKSQDAQRRYFTPENMARFKNPETGALDLDRMMEDAVGQGAVNPQQYTQHAQVVQQRREAQADRAKQAVAEMERRREELQMRMEDKTLDRAMRMQLAQQQQQLTAMIAQGNQAIQGMAAQTARMGLDMRRDDLDYRRGKDAQDKAIRGAEHLSSQLDKENFPGLLSTTRRLNDTLSKYSPTDVPGVGYAKNLGLANFFLSEEGKLVKSQVQAVANDLLKLYSGGAVTMNEGQRRTVEQMSSGAFGPQDLYNAWPTVVERVNAVAGNRSAGVTPEALQEYSRRPGALKLDPITPTKGRQGPAQQSGVVVRTPDGQTFTFSSQKEADNFRRDAGIR